MQCLGPPESDWNQRNFQVTPSGCFGGRKMPENLDKEFIVFRDTTVSRRHFEISYDAVRAVYALRDLGSAGGSFIRIPYGAKKALHPGMILLMGKHQFTVSSVDKRVSNMANEDSPGKDLEMKTMSPGDAKMDFEPRRVPDGLDAAANESALSEIMDDAEAFLDLLEKATSNSNSKDFKRSDDHQIDRSKIIKNKLNSLKAGLMQQQISVKQLSTIAQSKGESKGELAEHQELSKYAGNSMTLTCFAPDASPIQGKGSICVFRPITSS